MKRLGFMAAVFLLLGVSQSWAWEFNQDGNKEGWMIGQAIKNLEVKDGKMIATMTAGTNDPFINGPFGPFDGDRITGVEMKMRWSADVSNTGGKSVYYFPAAGSHGSVDYAIPYPNEWIIVYLDLLTAQGGDSPQPWGGEINSIRIDVADNVPEDYTVEIDWVRFVDGAIENDNFELGDLYPWKLVGQGTIDSFQVNDKDWYSEFYNVEVAGLGSDKYHGLSQSILGGLELAKGTSVAVVGAAKIPAGSWDANSTLWFRISESNGTTENNSPPIEVKTFDQWFEFESRLTLQYEPAARKKLDVELYSKNPSGKTFFFDDIFADIQEPKEEEEYWAWPNSNWEFNTDGDFEGWSKPGWTSISSMEVANGVLTIHIPAGANDPVIEGPAGPYNANRMKGIAARMRVSSGASLAGWANYWFPVVGGHASKGYTVPAEGEWFVLYQDLSDSWDGWFNNIRYDFGDFSTVDYTVEIDWIRWVDEGIGNDGFEGDLAPWRHEGAGSIADFTLTKEKKFSGESSLQIKGLGSDQYHAAVQDIENGLKIPKGATVTLRGYYYVPASSWDANSHIWFRVQEWNGKVENNVGSILKPEAFDAWVPFEHKLTLQFDPSERIQMAIQLYSKTPAGTFIYADDLFATVYAAPLAGGWPVNAVKVSPGQKIAIDGKVTPEEYAGAQPMVMNSETLSGPADPYFPEYAHAGVNSPGAEKPTSLEDFNATYYFMWDDEFFYAAVSVQDDNYSYVGPYPNGSDALQFVFAETPEETLTAMMYIPTIAADKGGGVIDAKNDFDGWLKHDIMSKSTYAASVDPDTQDWSVEIKIPWSAMQGDFTHDIFPPKTGDKAGFAVLAIDYDNGALDWFGGNHSSFPWQSLGVERMFFIESPVAVKDWSLF